MEKVVNIFCLDKDPVKAAQYHVDRHVVKMILETAQLLSTAHRVLDDPISKDFDDLLYKATHVNHPSAKYVRSSSFAYKWTHSLLVALADEYYYRYNNSHKCENIGLIEKLATLPKNIPIDETEIYPTLAMPDEYRTDDVVESYRAYYIGEKQHLASWKGRQNGREVPYWYILDTPQGE